MRALRTTRATAQPEGALLVQCCSCGSEGKSASGMCEECQEKEVLGLQPKLVVGAADDPYEREADRAAEAVTADRGASVAEGRPMATVRRRTGRAGAGAGQAAPPSVSRAISRSGEPLGRSARAYFEPRFGHDFGNVRVHCDAEAAASARDVAARAYTVGNHVVFGAGRYSPDSRGGRGLIAHELAHVIQQTGKVQRHSLAPEAQGEGDLEENEEEMQLSVPPGLEQDEEGAGGTGLVQREPEAAPEPEEQQAENDEKEDEPKDGEESEEDKKIEECMKNTPPDPAEREPDRALTWADFPGQIENKPFSAMTYSKIRKVAANTALLKCKPDSPDAAKANAEGAQAYLEPKSWVRKKFADPTNDEVNGCPDFVEACEKAFDKGDSWWRMSPKENEDCKAMVRYRGDKANKRSECKTVVAKDCTDQTVAESARLLKHEQGHFDITSAIARKANAKITKTTDVDALVKKAEKLKDKLQRRYDKETKHGCNATKQASWEKDIGDGLPKETIK